MPRNTPATPRRPTMPRGRGTLPAILIAAVLAIGIPATAIAMLAHSSPAKKHHKHKPRKVRRGPAASFIIKASPPVPLSDGRSRNYLTAQVRPGPARQQLGYITVRNTTRKPITVSVRKVTALTAPDLGVVYNTQPRTRPKGAARWIRLSKAHWPVPAHSTRIIPVRMIVARKAKAGQYVAGIYLVQTRGKRNRPVIARTITLHRGKHRFRIREILSYTIGTLITVARPHKASLRIRKLGLGRYPGGLMFTARIQSTSNTLLNPVTGSVTITHNHRRVIARRIGPGSILPHTQPTYPLYAPHLKAGTYRDRTCLTYPVTGKRRHRTTCRTSTLRINPLHPAPKHH